MDLMVKLVLYTPVPEKDCVAESASKLVHG
jgi:hypothetical protein